ncbi:MAG: hypothetical protein PHE53_07415 [Thermoguttaceae bacterium]|nr:hypothetical protein [Thermoguttaceae bacterium]
MSHSSVEVICPQCHQPILLEDIQPAANLAICRQCQVTHQLSRLVSENELDIVNLDQKPRQVTIENESDGLRVTYKRIPGMFWFFLLFTCIWGGGSIGLIYIKPLLIDRDVPSTAMLLGGIPFVIGSIVLIGVLFCMSCGRHIVQVNSTGRQEGTCTHFYGVGSFGVTKRIDYHRDTEVLLEDGNCKVNNQPLKDIVIRNRGEKEVRFGAFIPETSKLYLAALIRTTMLP